jgi:hypothetical protein
MIGMPQKTLKIGVTGVMMEDKPKRKRDHEASWWQFPRPFSYRLESDYDTIIQILERLERHESTCKFTVVLYDNHKNCEAAFEMRYYVRDIRSQQDDWEIGACMTGRVWKEEQVVIVESTVVNPTESRNFYFFSIVVVNAFCILGSWALGALIMGLIAAVLLNSMAFAIITDKRTRIFNHLSNGLWGLTIPLPSFSAHSALKDGKTSLITQNQGIQPYKRKKTL